MGLNCEPIYTITTLRGTIHNGIRCVGFTHELETAIEMVEDNAMDINENGYYHFAVIEKVLPGIYNIELDHIWFKWRKDKEGGPGYVRIDKPDQFKRICGFGIG